MQIEIAKGAGYCFGVKRVIDIIEELLAKGVKVCTLGSVIHNSRVVKDLESRGVIKVENPDDVPKGYTLVIRSHGISPAIMGNIVKNAIYFVDGTCPFVKKIHKIVEKGSNLGKIILIAGDRNHPEIRGIIGECTGKYLVFNNCEELDKLLKIANLSHEQSVILVAQTTFSAQEWGKCKILTKNLFVKPEIYDTICITTQFRQKECEKLSKKSDCMIVIGDKHSSNTNKLYNICRNNCKSFLIQSKRDLPMNKIRQCVSVGIAAGASTPEDIIREVRDAMFGNSGMSGNDDGVVEVNSEDNFEALLEKSFKDTGRGRRVTGTVENIAPTEIYVDIGRKQSGIVPLGELTRDPSKKPEDIVKVGDVLDLLITKVNEQEGTILLSMIKVQQEQDWEEVYVLHENGTVINGKIIKNIKGGLLASYKSLEVFIPASHIGGNRSIPLESYLGQEVQFKIIEVDRHKSRIIGSIKEAMREGLAQRLAGFWDNIEVGRVYQGTVRSLTDYAAFIDLGGIDGMLHVSEISWDRTKKPEDIFTIGQQIEVRIKSFDKEKGKVSLTYKKDDENPWNLVAQNYPVGTIFDAQIVSIVPFGAFARVMPGIDGLIHISQMSPEHIETPEEVVHEGQIVKVKVRDIDLENRKIGLTMLI